MKADKIGFRKRLALNLFAKYYQKKVQEHELETLFWECTLRCNLACKHCGSDCRKESAYKDMPAEDFLKVIDSITLHVNPNNVMIVFSGGEPLMRKDIEYVGLELYKRGYPWGMVTNGMALTRQRLDSLMHAGLHSITVSLDGFAEQHNAMRGNPESFARAWNAIQMIAQEKEIVYDVVTCVNQHNFPTLEEMKQFLVEGGVKYWRIFTIFPSGRAAEDPEMFLSHEQTVALMEFIKKVRAEKEINITFACEGFLGDYEAEVRDHFYYCSAGVNTAGIRIDGAISGCTSIRARYDQGNIYQDDFMEVWNNRFEMYRNREWMKHDQCADCKVFKYCLGGGMHLRDEEHNMKDCLYLKLTEDA